MLEGAPRARVSTLLSWGVPFLRAALPLVCGFVPAPLVKVAMVQPAGSLKAFGSDGLPTMRSRLALPCWLVEDAS